MQNVKLTDDFHRQSVENDNPVQHYVMKFVSDLRQVGCFLQGLRIPPPLILTGRNDITEINC